jgi:hypothetical protein
MNYNHPQFRDMAGRLAQSFESEKGERILRLITQLSGSRDRAGSLTGELKKPSDTPGKLRVGTWEATDESSRRSFVRVSTEDPWHLWANVQKIPPKSLRRRIVLVGESVARGLLFDPQFTPALALQQMMNVACGPGKIEVVDLARTDLSHKELHELIGQALHLEPNALVIFAGNNWLPAPSEEQLLDMARAFRDTGSWRGVKESIESYLVANIKQTLRLLEEIGRQRGIPVVFVLPEFNLADWLTECDSPPLLNNEETQSWLRAKCEAEQLLNGNDWEKAERLGERLLQLDQGTTAAGPNILAEVSQKRGDHEAARTFLEMARDSTMSLPFKQTPRCYSVVQQTIREGAAAHGIHLVDLPREFTKYLGGKPADRRLFLDYCHLTLEGINLSMALTAETLLPLLRYPTRSSKELAQVDMKVDANVNATAHFLAGVHSGNWGQKINVIRHHVRTALEYDRGIANMMQLFLDLHIRRVPSSLCESYGQVCESQNLAAIIAFYNDSIRDKFLNTKLITAVSEELEEVGIPTRALVQELMIKEHGVNENRAVNLVHNLYSTDSYTRFLVDLRPGFYKATARNTIFPLVCDKSEPLKFTITMKVPAVKSDQTISLRLNGNLVAELPATDRWTTTTFSAPAELVHPYVNHAEIGWPMPLWSNEEREHVAECLETGEVVEVTPMFGLIHSFRVSTG